MTNGFIIINKEKGFTSHDYVRQIRKLLNIKKVGHTGTLDPEVTGILPIAIGNATRFIQYLPQEKTYLGKIKLGIKTTTDDMHGEIICKKDWPLLKHNQLDKYLNCFRGVIQQIPPKVSSIHIDGERAYQKSFRNEDFELTAKEVIVKELFLKNWDQKNGLLEVKIKCSSGTYIRSIARDLGKLLNSEGCLFNLKRTEANGFHEKNSIKISDLKKLNKNLTNFIIPTISALNHISTFVLKTKEEINYWETGRKIEVNDKIINCRFEHKDPLKVVDIKTNLLGIGFINQEKNYIYPKLVLNAK